MAFTAGPTRVGASGVDAGIFIAFWLGIFVATSVDSRHTPCSLSSATSTVRSLAFSVTQEQASPVRLSMSQDVLRKARVLIVDDEPSNVRLLERILELNGA